LPSMKAVGWYCTKMKGPEPRILRSYQCMSSSFFALYTKLKELARAGMKTDEGYCNVKTTM
jgi:hypothetical protein